MSNKKQNDKLINFIRNQIKTPKLPNINSINLPKITIITPSYNQGVYLERTIMSIINQNYPKIEYMIFDAKSKDNSVEIIKKYEPFLSYWESEKDQGQSDAISKGFKKATGEVLAWLNSDDVYWPEALLTVGRYFAEHPEVDVVYGNSFTIDKNDNILRETRSVKFSKMGLKTLAFSMHQASIFWRRSIYDKVEGLRIDLQFIMDTDLWFQFLLAGACFRHINSTLSCYRTHDLTKANQFEKEVNKTRDLIFKERFGIDSNSIKFKMERKAMRIRTLLLNIKKGNLLYLIQNAGKRY
jgi:glycosyltransferase involved in cell wall biosynthesis